MVFSRDFNNWPLHNDETLNLVHIETQGLDLEDFLSNASITIEDWHGNEGGDIDLGDLSSKDYDAVVQLFAEYLAGA